LISAQTPKLKCSAKIPSDTRVKLRDPDHLRLWWKVWKNWHLVWSTLTCMLDIEVAYVEYLMRNRGSSIKMKRSSTSSWLIIQLYLSLFVEALVFVFLTSNITEKHSFHADLAWNGKKCYFNCHISSLQERSAAGSPGPQSKPFKNLFLPNLFFSK
jgi:hypothetical protein